MQRKTERGEGKLGAILTLLFLAAAIYAAWNVAPAYVENSFLKDKMNEVARTPKGLTTDEKLLDQLDRYVREERLTAYLQRTMFVISTVETSRRISVTYQREVQVLPGWKKVLTFTNEVDQPLIF
jgi:hypothetical protein